MRKLSVGPAFPAPVLNANIPASVPEVVDPPR